MMYMNDTNVSFRRFEPKTVYFGGRMRLVTCLETNKAGNGPNRPRAGRFYLFEDIHRRLAEMNGGYAFCVKNTLGDVVLFKTVKIKDSSLLMNAEFSHKGVYTVYWSDIFPEYAKGAAPAPKTKKEMVNCANTAISTTISGW